MISRSLLLGSRSTLFPLFLLTFFLFVSTASPQTTQPYLFASSYNSPTNSTGSVTLLRDTTTGVVSMPPNTAVFLKDPCTPSADPNKHGMLIFVNQPQSEGSPAALLFSISFDPSTGQPNIPSSGLNIDASARSLAIGPSGTYFALGSGSAKVLELNLILLTLIVK